MSASGASPGKSRLKISTQVMRQLMFASGGRCAMTGCGLSLIAPSGGWIGTVAHIVGAEKDGPRGAGPISAEERRGFDNLILMCATHGREVDAVDTGEAKYPIDKLRMIKAAYEAKVSEAVERAVEEELTGIRTATGLVDTALRSANVAVSGEGLAESLNLRDGGAVADLTRALDEARSRLQRVSQPGLDGLSQLLSVWLMHCHLHGGEGYYFDDPTGIAPRVPVETVDNRIALGKEQSFEAMARELQTSGLLSVIHDEDEHSYVLDDPWQFPGPAVRLGYWYSFWPSVAEFLYAAHGVEVQDWVRTLDFSIFDRRAPDDRDVPWR